MIESSLKYSPDGAKTVQLASMPKSEGNREMLKMKARQIPVLVNIATTGHKLQESGIDNLFVHDWSYITNWA
jgi:hypothetical protein